MNTRSKLVTLVALTALATVAGATTITTATVARLSGYLTPGRFGDHTYAVGQGFYKLDLRNDNMGDLDAKIFNLNGKMLRMNIYWDNSPTVWFYSERPQTIKVRAINRSRTNEADYSGMVTRIR